MKLKIMQYNILNGFCGNSLPYKIDQNNLERMVKVVQEVKPDILILNEAYFWPFAKKIDMEKIGEELNSMYNQYTSLADTQFRWAPVVLSRFDVSSFDSSASKYFLNFLRSNLKIKNKNLTLDVFHPHPSKTEAEKSDFLKEILGTKRNYILSGDLNSLSPQDSYDVPKFTRGYESFMKDKGKSKAHDMLKRLTVKTILDFDLVDTYKTVNGSPNFTIPTDLMSKNKDASARIDYIFCSRDLGVTDFGIIKNKLTEKASDHYPIYAVLEL